MAPRSSLGQLWTPQGLLIPRVRVTPSADQSISNNTVTALAFNTETYDTDAIHDTVTNNSRLTCRTPGAYVIRGDIEYATSSGGSVRLARIRLNGSTSLETVLCVPIAGGNSTILLVSTEYELAAGDYVELLAFQESGGALNVVGGSNSNTQFSMWKINSG